jgi:glutamine phosphoribosylpyrophosphate amidotransferase
MCIAILTTPGKRLTNQQLWKGWTITQDGGGLAFVKDGKVVVSKGHRKYNDFQKAYEEAYEEVGLESPFLIHMRIGTSGLRSANNTHPFEFKPQSGPSGAMIHNGIMFSPAGEWKGPQDDRKSDTRVFVAALNNILALEDLKRAKEAVGKAIGGGNKLVFLFDDKSWVIVNEDEGYWDDGIWYSNIGCRVSEGNNFGFRGK